MDRELPHREQVVRAGRVDGADAQHGASAIRFDALHGHAVAQPVVGFLIGIDHGLAAIAGQLPDGLVDLSWAEPGIESLNGGA